MSTTPRAAPSAGPLGEITLVESETFCVSGTSGQIRRGGEQGLYLRDTRVLDRLILRLDDQEPVILSGQALGPSSARFTAYWRAAGDTDPDPRLFVDRRRVVSASLWEGVSLTNYGLEPAEVRVELRVGSDFAYIFDVKHGRQPTPAPAELDAGGLKFTLDETKQTVLVRPRPPADEIDAVRGAMRWDVTLAPRARWSVEVDVGVEEAGHTVWPVHPPTRTQAQAQAPTRHDEPAWPHVEVRCSDMRLPLLVSQSTDDLASLLVVDPEHPADRFLAAGSPWYLTLFGRDSLWAAFMALPIDVGLAGETLRVLARRQGSVRDPVTEEAPGKILHEVRHGGLSGRADLPPLYYGTMDATPLWVTLLHEAWRWGLAPREVEALLPAMERALGWLLDDADADGDGFLEYARSTERGLENQGWKDSHDGVQFADGTLASSPIALCEVQGYAYEAAMRGADLLDAFGRPGADAWRAWAADLKRRFRGAFWVGEGDEAYPALALDGAKRPVDGLASNMGHLPGTGLLDPQECAQVARVLARPDMDSGWGLRTLTSRSPRFNPLSYHGGSVWPHDTAVAVHNLALAGQPREAGALLFGLVRAAPHFDYRMPELFGGEQRAQGSFPIPYPAACRPQAWSAGASLLVLRALLGLHPDLPAGRVELRPLWPLPFRQLYVGGIAIGGGSLAVTVVRDEGVFVHEAPTGVRVEVIGAPTLSADPGPVGPLRVD